MKKLCIYVILSIGSSAIANAQFTDDFSDGEISINPEWVGQIEKFEVDEQQRLHLNAPPITDYSYISTPSVAIANAEWQWYTEISENPSASNYIKVYLVTDHNQLDGSLHGYFVKIGGTNDEVSLYRQDGQTETLIIDGSDDKVNTKPVKIWVKVTRDNSGTWSLYVKPIDEVSYLNEGQVFDDTYLSSSYFGVLCQYTSTRSKAFYIDGIAVSGGPIEDTIPPVLAYHTVNSAHQISLHFSETLDVSSIVESNFLINGEVAQAVVYENDTVFTTFLSPLPNAVKQQLTINGIKDEADNQMQDTIVDILYFEKTQAKMGSLVINEFFPDPTPSKLNLPDDSNAEFIELYNPGPHPYQLLDWKINDVVLPDYLLLANEYVILCKEAFKTEYDKYGTALALKSWPTLPNSGSTIILVSDEETIIDSVTYTSSLVEEGISLERIHTITPCSGVLNFASSSHINGATPGEKNSVYSDFADNTGPNLLNITPLSKDSIVLKFDEKVLLNYPSINQFNVNANQNPEQAIYLNNDSTDLLLTFSPPLTSNTRYELEVKNVVDCLGNSNSSQKNTFYLDLDPPHIYQLVILDTNAILIQFSEAITKASAEREINYRLLPHDEKPSRAILEEDSSSVKLTFAKSFSGEEKLSLQTQEVEDLYQNLIPAGMPITTSINYTTAIDDVFYVNQYQLDVQLNQIPQRKSALNPLNYLLNKEIGHPSKILLYDEKDGLVHLLLQNSISTDKDYTLSIRNLFTIDSTLIQTPDYHLYFDTKGPKITSVEVLSAKTLAVHFNEHIDTLLSKNLVATIDHDTVEFEHLDIFQDSLLLTFNQELYLEKTYELNLSGVYDLQKNTSQTEYQFLFDHTPPKLDSAYLYAHNQLMLQFHEALLSENKPANQYIELHTPDISPIAIKFFQRKPTLALITLSESITSQDIHFTYKNFSDLQSNRLEYEIDFEFDMQSPSIGNIMTLSHYQIRVNFSNNIANLNLRSDNFLVNDQIKIDSLDIISAHSIDLWFEHPFEDNTDYDLSFNYDQVQQHIAFTYPNYVENIEFDGNSTIVLTFNLPLDGLSAENIDNYHLTNQEKPIVALYKPDRMQLQLLFAEKLDGEQIQMLYIDNLFDIDKLKLHAMHLLFGHTRVPQLHELLVTEIMANPSLSTTLAEVEYIEIYNASSFAYPLNQLQLSDAQKKVKLSNKWLLPGQYLILCSPADILKLSGFGNCLGVEGFPNLNNDTDTLSLINIHGQIIHEVAYHESWYNDAYKMKGGWSLEMIDTNWPCQEKTNWIASNHQNGGTPGTENSVKQSNPDLQFPELIQAVADDSLHITLSFNEKLHEKIVAKAQFFLENNAIDIVTLSKNKYEICLKLSSPLKPKTKYKLTYNSISDCSENTQLNPINVEINLAEKHLRNDILISEILFHAPSGSVEFIELYNHSDKYINLKNWSISVLKDEGLIEKSLISDHTLIMEPGAYLAISNDSELLKANYPLSPHKHFWESKNLPSLQNEGGVIHLHDDLDSIMQIINFSPEMHHPLLYNAVGVSLERISWNDDENNAQYWQSAASSVGYATPAASNSQWINSVHSNQGISIDPPIFYPDQSGYLDYTKINIQIEGSGNIGNLNVFDIQGQLIRHLAQNYSFSKNGFIIWDGTDDHKKRVKTGYYIVWLEVFNPKGSVNIYKSKVVVGSKF